MFNFSLLVVSIYQLNNTEGDGKENLPKADAIPMPSGPKTRQVYLILYEFQYKSLLSAMLSLSDSDVLVFKSNELQMDNLDISSH